MSRFTPTERKALSLGVCLLTLATGVRLALAPGDESFAWQRAPGDRPAESAGQALDRVADTIARAEAASRPLAPGETIDPNEADAVQLQRLPGVGPARAAAILRERETGGPFRSVDDLQRVSGIGPAMAARWSEYLRLTVPAGGAVGAAMPSRGIDLNRAHPKELEQITGIGPATAARIVEARERNGRFSSIEDLLEIPGIGPKTLQILREEAFVR